MERKEGDMNEKFFDLKKEKQDRMINAALKVFAENGYGHASTDEIVREAGISKGLLFHYFVSKLGLYSFIYDYSVRYMMLELMSGVSKDETDFFTLINQIQFSQFQVMKNYPYMLLFLDKSKYEDVSEALVETEEKRNILPGWYDETLSRVDEKTFRSEVDLIKLRRVIDFTTSGLMAEHFADSSFQPEIYYEEMGQYLQMLKKITCKK